MESTSAAVDTISNEIEIAENALRATADSRQSDYMENQSNELNSRRRDMIEMLVDIR